MGSASDVRVLGIEGTAWAASAALYDGATDSVHIETEAYQPESGGLHPREAAEHMAEHLPKVAESVLERARNERDQPIDAVAFSRGPGLGPCLRLAGTTARALAQRLDVPLVGVNHMVAHLEIGRHLSGFSSPVCLNASGANAHILGYRNGRYRVLGETMDTGVGNAIDKFTRHVGWSHPGGPKVEEAAANGSYVDLPYVVKGMDFSFSGIMSAAKDAVDTDGQSGAPVEDVCHGLQENIFAMLTEVAERALSLTGSSELVLGGGVGQNQRLQSMLASMCEQRGADFFAPENRFLRDNAGMIAVLGAKMYAAGDTVAIDDSGIDSNFRPDEVPVTWRDDDETVAVAPIQTAETVTGAEATVRQDGDKIIKRRNPREYRHPTLDEQLRKRRTRQEARLTQAARKAGVPTPLVRDVDLAKTTLVFQHVGDRDLRAALGTDTVETTARHLARIHQHGFVHGDPTTRNVRVDDASETVFLIDFGLGYHTDAPEDHAMDLHVLAQSLAGTTDDANRLTEAATRAYGTVGDAAVIDQLDEIEGRGRYQ
ncbi:bifunctional N6-L-threonylcarbamoyladenine synthase / protein kinase Bud32 [Halovenus aranensis]|uniref:Probable bifunctional tRNA threonylcarbamoyladenosine biosynthesis protein n=1 Tax=Halovenus aranensis TaxID=890420 RepID=A0A1G8W8U2_9EURY|nr:bifunctional N(6)-L-threonylcarbamoyladenine synthase/serine/threonine protein kinase [Halovenus aranensis]SDJ74714.1 bifunctional N6-L-threonylcarbamoyladenine synthase / protein kinase Bud32 [Halovenus aranensis]